MAESLRILILEDNPADVELVQFELQEAGLVFVPKIVTTEEDFIREIEEFCPDLILSDYDLPRYDGSLALAEARKRCPDTPFILVTGAVTEDRAIEILTQGAKDYVLKNRLEQRLGPSVKRALAEAREHSARKRAEEELHEAHRTLEEKVKIRTAELEAEMAARKKSEEALRESESRERVRAAELQTVMDMAPVAVWIAHDPQCLRITGNRYADEIMHVPPDANISASVVPGEAAVTYRVFRNGLEMKPEELPAQVAASTGRPVAAELLDLVFSDGRVVTTILGAMPLFDAEGRVRGSVAAGVDVTRLRKAEEALRQTTERFDMAQHAAEVGTWDWNITTGEIEWSNQMFNLFRLDPRRNIASFELWESIIHPEDVKTASLRIEEALSQKTALNSDYRIVLPDGQTRWINAVGESKYDDQGQPIRMIGICTDITERKKAEDTLQIMLQRLHILVSNMQSSILFVGEGGIELANQAFCDYFELPEIPADLIGLTPNQLMGKIKNAYLHPEEAIKRIQEIIDRRQPVIGEETTLHGGRTCLRDFIPINIDGKSLGRLWHHTDITERKNREKEQEKFSRTLRALAKSNQAIMQAADEYRYMQEVCKIIVEDCGYRMVWVGFAQNNKDKTVRPVAYSGFEEGYIEALKVTWADTERGRGPTGTAIRTGKPTACKNMLADPHFQPWREEAMKRGYASSIALPLIAYGKAFGALTIYSEEPDHFAEDEVKLLAELADDFSYGIMAIRWRQAREEAEEALRESEEKYRNLVKYAPAAIYEMDIKGTKFFSVNDVMCEILGYSREELLSIKPTDLLDQKSKSLFKEMVKKNLSGEKTEETAEYRIRRKDSEWIYTVVNVGAFSYTNKKSPRVAVIAHDITGRKRAEEAILRVKEEWERTFDTIPDLIAILDKEHRILRINKAMADRLGLALSQCIGIRCYEVVHGLSQPPEFCPHALTCRDGYEHVAEVHEAVLGGDFLVSTTPLCDENGQVIGSIHVARNITQRKQMEEELRQKSYHLEAANKELESFSYSVSHDLRAPLRAIDGFSRIILRQWGHKFDKDTRNQFDLIRDNIKIMGVLIDDLLSFSKLQKTAMSVTTIDMDKLAAEVWKELSAANKERALKLKIAKILPGYGDRTLVKQVLFNLFDNAVKFTKNRKQGIIEMRSYKDAGSVVYCLKDNGAGFDMAYYDKLFGVFQRLHSNEEYEGTGVGLAIVQRIIDRHGGRVWAEGEVGKGATFYFTLPAYTSSR